MNSLWPIVIGGILPALFWGITAIFQKQSATAATGSAIYLIAFGAACALAGLIAALIWRPAPGPPKALALPPHQAPALPSAPASSALRFSLMVSPSRNSPRSGAATCW